MASSPLANIGALNSMSLSSFRAELSPYDSTFRYFNEGVSTSLALHVETASSISSMDMNACFNLIASTSSKDYKVSSIGWSPSKKKREMQLPDLRYILLKRKDFDEDNERESLVGFLSFMLTYEDGYEVVYCYEVHLALELQGKGIGKRLMQMMEEVGKRARVEKAMLTSFKANKNAVLFYERLGYLEDEFSPRPRKLRNGIVKEPDYIILSKMQVNKDNKPECARTTTSTEKKSRKLKAG